MKLKLAVNKGCLNKTNPQDVAHGWLNIQEPIEWLEGWVKAGYGWCQRILLTATALQTTLVVPTSSSLTLMVTQRSHASGLRPQLASGVQLHTPALLTQRKSTGSVPFSIWYGA